MNATPFLTPADVKATHPLDAFLKQFDEAERENATSARLHDLDEIDAFLMWDVDTGICIALGMEEYINSCTRMIGVEKACNIPGTPEAAELDVIHERATAVRDFLSSLLHGEHRTRKAFGAARDGNGETAAA